ncbi:Uncharacterised protein [Mycobacteroides abscessus]|nr:Uncharacterised protein [Mycobacteroides abscessus]
MPPDAVPTPKPLRKPSTTSPTSGQRTTTDTRSATRYAALVHRPHAK